MTTRVTILNQGPNDVEVRTYQLSTGVNARIAIGSVKIKPREFTESYVYGDQQIAVLEVEHD